MSTENDIVKEPAEDPPFLNLAELAARWRRSEKEAIAIVKQLGVPFLPMTIASDRIPWRKILFSLPDIKLWEQTHQVKLKGGSATPVPATTAKGKPTAKRPSRLGNWRDSTPVR